MAAQTFTIPRTTFQTGTTSQTRALTGITVHTLGVQCDITQWTLPGTLSIGLEASTDNGVTWRGAGGAARFGPPDANDDGGPATAIGFAQTFPAGLTPTNVRWTVIVTGNAIPLGPSTITVT